jgi:predicted molibdopterin-dependent oxidoreductase YjgC
MKKTQTTCTYCGVGCQIDLETVGSEVLRAQGVKGVPPNFGHLCVKGKFGFDFIHNPERLSRPLIRKNGALREASWEEALDLVARRFVGIREEFGPQALGALTSARILNEENYLLQKLIRGVFKTNNIDHCARL